MRPSIRNDVQGLVKELKRLKWHIRPNSTVTTFFDNYVKATDLRDNFVETAYAKQKPEIIGLSNCNFLVNLITALEVFLKSCIHRYKDKWDEEGVAKLLDEPIKLNDAFILFQHPGIEKADLISYNYVFQSTITIEKVFGRLTNTPKFLKAVVFRSWEKIGENEWKEREDTSLWRRTLSDAYDLRHKIIHEGFYEPIDQTQLALMASTILEVVVNFGVHFDKLPDKKKR
jgi:hypothetical protein